QLAPPDLTWQEGHPDWKPASSIPGLFPEKPAPAPAPPAAPEPRFYYHRQGQQLGPVAFEQLKALAAANQLAANDLVWQEGMPNWQPAEKINGLLPAPAPTPQPA